MAAEIYLDQVEIECDVLEAVLPGASRYSSAAYPLPQLVKSGSRSSFPVTVAVLENEFARISIATSLGGRIFAWHDKSSGLDVIPVPKSLELVAGGPRGVHDLQGIQFAVLGAPHAQSLGPVEFHADENEKDGSPVLVLHNLEVGNRLSWSVGISLPAHSPNLSISFRALNRGWTPIAYTSGLLMPASRVGEIPEGALVQIEGSDLVIQAEFGPGAFALGWKGGVFRVLRAQSPYLLGPRQLDTWTVQLSAHRGDIVDGLPGQIDDCLSQGLELWHEPFASQARLARTGQADKAALEQIFRFQGAKHAVSSARAFQNIAVGNFPEADANLDAALATNAEDHLTWWLRAVVQRLAGTAEDDSPVLPNAHFLSPMEPALRAEAFLSQPQTHSREPNPLVAPLAGNPDAMLEVAHLLLEAGLNGEAARWLDESVRHADHRMLRIMTSWNFLVNSRMDAEAAHHLALASKLPLVPPFPWRELERRAVADLLARFPAQAGVVELADLLKSNFEEPAASF